MNEFTDKNGTWIKGKHINKLIKPSQEFIEKRALSSLTKKRQHKRMVIRFNCNKLLNDYNLNVCNAENWELLSKSEKAACRKYKAELKNIIENIKTIDVDAFQYPEKP